MKLDTSIKFQFQGNLDVSKSWMNRFLILQSFEPQLKTEVQHISADDSQHLIQALNDFKNNKQIFYVGLGGTTFRFLALRLSREVGVFTLQAEEALFKRPQSELLDILNQLGVKAYFKSSTEFVIESKGWKPVSKLTVSVAHSSQFISAVALASINLPFDLLVKPVGTVTSESYFLLTLDLLTKCGISVVKQNDESYLISKNQKLKKDHIFSELDVSSGFSLIAAAVLAGDCEILNWCTGSLQPDMAFLSFFNQMKIQFSLTNSSSHQSSKLSIKAQSSFRALTANLSQCPDLFPVLAVLCAFAEGTSVLHGAHQLAFKESHRIEKTYELLQLAGFQAKIRTDGLEIIGEPNKVFKTKNIIYFDPAHDHRMAFAASLLQLKGFPLLITHPDVIKKSYPQFYQHVGLDKLNNRDLAVQGKPT